MKTEIIGSAYRNILKPFFFGKDPEDVHDRMLAMGHRLGKNELTRKLTHSAFNFSHPALEQSVDGIEYMNPLGLSAGFDKDGYLINILDAVGFGFMQVGSVTWKAYEGNPKPRLTRLPESKGLVVYYGLKNQGVKKIATRLKTLKNKNFKISVSIAKTNSDSTAKEADGIEDYYQTLAFLAEHNLGDLYTINISCPNTFGGEPFTTPDKLDRLFKRLTQVKHNKPVYVKMPLNMEWNEFKQLADVIVSYNLQGMVLSNLNKQRDPSVILDDIPADLPGGISGKPTQALSDKLIANSYLTYKDKLTIVGVGGVFNAEDAYRKITAGSTLVQLITGMIYQGPQLIGEINRGLVKLLERDGFTNISEAIGTKAEELQ